MAVKPTINTQATNSQIKAAKLNEALDTLATSIQGCLGRGGTSENPNSMTGNLDMDNNRIQNLGDPINAKDAVTLNYINTLAGAGTDLGFAVIVEVYTATSGQTVFPLVATYQQAFNSVAVFKNGLRLLPSEYEETTDSSITLLSAATLGDKLMFAINQPISTTDPALIPAGEDLLTARDTAVNAVSDAVAAASIASTVASSASASAAYASSSASSAATSASSAANSAVSASNSATAAANSAASAAAITNASAYARAIGGDAYRRILGIVCPPSLEVMAWDTQGANDGAPAGFTFSRASTAMAFGPDGQLYTAAAGELRHEWDALTGEYKGWLLEGQNTNYLLNSGTPATQSVSLAAGTYTLWVVGSGSCALSGGPTGTATSGSPVTFTLAGTTAVTFTVSGSLTRFQCEGGSYPTSYIPTTSAQATREADSLSISTSAFPFNAAEGVLFCEASRVSIAHPNYPAIISFDDGTPDGNDTIQVYAVPNAGTIYGYGTVSGAVQANMPFGTSILAGVLARLALAYKTNDMAECANGGAVSTDTSCSLPTLTRLVLGSSQSMHIRHIAYFPRRLSNADLQTLTK